MSLIPELLIKKAEQLEELRGMGSKVKEALFGELVKRGMDENVAKGVSDEMEPSYMDMWSKLLTEPNGSYMDIPLDADELRKVAEYIEYLEKNAQEALDAPKRPLIEKLASAGYNPKDVEKLEVPTLEKIASAAGSDQRPHEYGSPSNIPSSGADAFTKFLLG